MQGMTTIAAVACLISAPIPVEDWTPKSVHILRPAGAPANATAVVISSDGKWVAGSSGGFHTTVRVWNTETGKCHYRFETEGDVLKIAFGPDNKSLVWGRVLTVVGGEDYDTVFVQGFGARPFSRDYDIFGGAFVLTPDGKQFGIRSGGRIRLYDIVTGEKGGEVKLEGGLWGFAFTPDGKVLLSVRRFGAENCNLIRRDIAADKFAASEKVTGFVYTIAPSPDGKQFATGHPGGAVKVWDADCKEVRAFEMKVKGRAHPFFSPDGKFLAAGDQDTGEVVVWDRASGQEVRRFTFQDGALPRPLPLVSDQFRPNTDPVRFAFHPASRAILVGCHGVQLVALADGKVIQTFGIDD